LFTGIVQVVGHVVSLEGGRLVVEAEPPDGWEPIQAGESVAVNGVCLTALQDGQDGVQPIRLQFDLSEETLARTALRRLEPGRAVNLERALRMSDRLGGHVVQGHVDGVGRLLSAIENDLSWTYRFEAPEGAGRYLIDKGSIAVDGISLTVVQPEGDEFSVAVIPHTMAHTNLHELQADDPVNLEFDVLAKYVERLLAQMRD
jgi:riboflavin synthase